MENSTPASVFPSPGEPQELGDFDKRLVDRIKNDKLSPAPRWHFLLKKYVIWISGILALLVGGASVAVMLYLFRYNDWELLPQLQQGFWQFFVLTLPYFWFIFLGIFIFILNYNFRHTSHGYRYPIWIVTGGSIVASLALGGVLYAAGWGEKIDNTLGANAPLYDQVINRHVIYWHSPQEGRLAGVIVDSDGEGRYTIIDPRGRQWQIMATSVGAVDFARRGEPIKILGRTLDDGRFQVKMMRPVRAGRSFMISRPLPPEAVMPGEKPGSVRPAPPLPSGQEGIPAAAVLEAITEAEATGTPETGTGTLELKLRLEPASDFR